MYLYGHRNVAFKADMMSQAVLEVQTSFVTPEARGQEASSERDSLDDDNVERNTYTFLIMKSLSVNFSIN